MSIAIRTHPNSEEKAGMEQTRVQAEKSPAKVRPQAKFERSRRQVLALLEQLRVEIEKMTDEPSDNTVNEEIPQTPEWGQKNIGDLLAKERADKITLKELADILGISVSFAWQVERGRAKLPDN